MKKIQILGTGCSKCKKLTEEVEKAAKALDIEYELEKVTDIEKIISFGVMTTPALIINGELKVTGRVPCSEELKEMICCETNKT